VTRRRKSIDDDPGLSVGQAAGVDNDDSILDHLRRVRPSVYGKPTREQLQRDLDRLVRRRSNQHVGQHL